MGADSETSALPHLSIDMRISNASIFIIILLCIGKYVVCDVIFHHKLTVEKFKNPCFHLDVFLSRQQSYDLDNFQAG